MIILQESPADYNEVYQLVKVAFDFNESTDGTVSDYLNELRTKDVFIPELSLIAEKDERIIGQITL